MTVLPAPIALPRPSVPSVIAALPPEARPREKLLAQGASTLSDAELLAILLRTGLPGRPVLSLARDVLDRCGGFRGLLREPIASLQGVKGLGPAKRTSLLAVLEVARRAFRETLGDGPVFESAEAVRDYLRLEYDDKRAECFAVMFLDTQHRLIALETLFHGTLSHTIAYPREVVKRALTLDAAAVILVHNHPSGRTDPSPQDVQLTRAMIESLALIDVKVLDHFIVGAGQPASMTDLGLL
ncbi:RadC family protein [Roseateles chitinivorans]|uniref:RadC family protein n=1 Tax=Roseateles chitinivorans TaxID=2917965 RepID=UPI003D67DB41